MIDRAHGRNVHIYDPRDPETILGGHFVTNGMTNTNFYFIIDIIIKFTTDYTLHRGQKFGPTIQRDNNPLEEGKYFIVAAGEFTINDELVVNTLKSLSAGIRDHEFRLAMRAQDRGWAISGSAVSQFNLARGYWGGPAYIRFNDTLVGRRINSVQNGLLLRADIHLYFDDYMLSINPDDNYMIVCFMDDPLLGVAGTHCDHMLRAPQRPSLYRATTVAFQAGSASKCKRRCIRIL
ncbi:hypothetical protein B9Z19DRAFT_1118126 [Tuber borchii]|uniref:Uncharacterized protein n=1 Tax=Tuber borchii TaxID=42251 RepID=A0A2T7A945_TUBBO|nr:hypothetical protein B9Z19DRAFT_1118126 [Tuber borchii]